MFRLNLFNCFSASLVVLCLAPLTLSAQVWSDAITELEFPSANISSETTDRFILLIEGLPDRHRPAVEQTMPILSTDTRLMILEMFNAFQTGDDRQDMRLIVVSVGLFKGIGDLSTYIATGAFPASGQLPDAIAQYERTVRAVPGIGDRLGDGFLNEVRNIQEEAYSIYEAYIASLDSDIEEARARTERLRIEGEQLAEAERRLEALYNALTATTQ